MKVELLNCIVCGKMFRLEGRDVRHCTACHETHEILLRKVKDVIINSPGLTTQEVSDKSGVPYKMIIEWINEGRIIR